ncbi:hypothetical protein HRR78_003551 [Exophiala dermatitidis]|nr:hypothetical protein HRR75_002931 [Exophiala dermatitidis]KAJ4551985.1 hypothetical protein HRR78_003551 [Exophiala dermatitidis]
MQNSLPVVPPPECLMPENSRDIVGLVYENLCNFRASKIEQRQQRTPESDGSPSASHDFTIEADEATPRKTDAKQIRPSNNFNPDQRSNSVLENAVGSEVPSEETSLHGSDLALRFAIEVVSKLHEKELDSFISFLHKEDTHGVTTNLQQLLTNEIEYFRTQEAGFTKEDAHGIAQPAGNPDCDLGLILHCQSREGGVTKFCDKGSQTIQLLSKKGLGPDVVFAYDWHWRGEGSARGRKSTCPASRWTKEKLQMHHQMSHRLLEILPVPFLIVGGRCAKKHYQEGRKHLAKVLNVKLSGNTSIGFEILFKDQSVRRITAFVDHPVASTFNPNATAQYSLRLDAGLNFMMWLLGLPHDERSFTETGAKFQKGMPGSAPLKEVHEHMRMETNLNRTLTVLEYDSAFLNWASMTLQEDVFKMLDEGQSVARALRTRINNSISKGLLESEKFAAANRRRNAARYGFEFKELWDAEEVTLTAKGYISLHLSEERRALKILVPLEARKRCLAAQAKNEKTVVFFTQTGVELKLGEDLIVTLSIDELRKQQGFGQEGVDQHHMELERKGELKRKDNGESELNWMVNS